MIIYSITTSVKNEYITEWLKWMKEEHIPNIMRTGYFENFKIYEVRVPTTNSEETTYIINYECESFEKYKEYADTEAARLRAAYAAKYSGIAKTARTVMESL